VLKFKIKLYCEQKTTATSFHSLAVRIMEQSFGGIQNVWQSSYSSEWSGSMACLEIHPIRNKFL